MKISISGLACASVLAVSGLASTTAQAQGWNYYVSGFAAATQASFDYSSVNDYDAYADSDISDYFNARGVINTTHAAEQTGLGGGYSIGLQRQFHEHYSLGLEVSEQFNGNLARAAGSWNLSLGNWAEDDQSAIPLNVNSELHLKHQLSFELTYGIRLPNKTDWLYVKAGPSIARLKESAVSSIDASAYADANPERFVDNSINTSSSTRSIWGTTFGAGYLHSINNWLFLFAEYNYAYYGQHNISTLSQNFVVTSDLGNDITSVGDITRKVKVVSSSIKLGLGFMW